MNRYRPILLRRLAVGFALALMTALTFGQASTDSLEQGFRQPPDSAKPRVWWHWMNGNITKEGIKLDLEWMHRVGLGGFQNFDAALATPQVVDKRLAYMTPEWKDAFKYATTLADQLGLEEAIAGSPGWSETGGPWVPPSQGMKKYVWSETLVEGGKPFTGTLATSAVEHRAFQNLGVQDVLDAPEGSRRLRSSTPIPQSSRIARRRVTCRSNRCTRSDGERGQPTRAMLERRRPAEDNQASDPNGRRKCLDPIRICCSRRRFAPLPSRRKSVDYITAMVAGIANPEKSLEASDDGQNFRTDREASRRWRSRAYRLFRAGEGEILPGRF